MPISIASCDKLIIIIMNKYLTVPKYSFSLYTKIPKNYQAAKPKSWIEKLFTRNQNSPTYVLLFELFDYLQKTELFYQQFPFLQNTPRMCENNMIIHTCLLRNRLASQGQLPRSEIQQFNYNVQTVFFPRYASFMNPGMPTSNFSEHFSEAYMKKMEIFNEQIKQYEFALSSNRLVATSQYCPLFRKLAYENRLNIENIELIKYCKYYYAHKKYLNSLMWEDLIDWKVKWGFQEGRLLDQIKLDLDKK